MDHCYICGNTRSLETHHCIHGTASRKKADQDGLTIRLCHRHHYEVHNGNSKLDLKLKKLAEREWLVFYGKTKEDFIKRYGKNYI